jgi:hypothetical protein
MRGTRRWALALLIIGGMVLAACGPTTAADPLEVFAGQDKNARVNGEVIFNDAKLVRPDPPDPARSYLFAWDFDASRDLNLDGIFDNDNETTTLLTSHVFTAPGTFTVTLWVYDSAGGKAKDTCQVVVVENLPPEIQVTENQKAFLNTPYTFLASATDDFSPEHMLRWEWDFGDGEKSNDAPPVTHTYNTLRGYQVRVRVYDPEQEWSERIISLNVVEKEGESGTTYQVDGGKLTQKNKLVREGGYIIYSLEAKDNHDI